MELLESRDKMKIDYKGKKWDKEMKRLREGKKYLGDGYLKNINFIIDRLYKTQLKDYYWFLSCLSLEYEMIAETYLEEKDIKNVLKAIYLSEKSFFYLKKMYMVGIEEDYNTKDILGNLEYYVCKAIAIDYLDVVAEYCQDSIVANLFYGNLTKTKEYVEDISSDIEGVQSIYYTELIFLKKLFEAILEKDERKFYTELIYRIKKYRSNMVGYSTIIDYVSIALIKIAKKYEMNCDLKIIEMPEYFFEPISTKKFEVFELPLQNEIEQVIQEVRCNKV